MARALGCFIIYKASLRNSFLYSPGRTRCLIEGSGHQSTSPTPAPPTAAKNNNKAKTHNAQTPSDNKRRIEEAKPKNYSVSPKPCRTTSDPKHHTFRTRPTYIERFFSLEVTELLFSKPACSGRTSFRVCYIAPTAGSADSLTVLGS